MMVLAGDVGGTKTLLCLARVRGGEVERVVEERYVSAEFDDFAALVRRFRREARNREPISAICLAVAGPVEGNEEHQHTRLTNLPWTLDTKELADTLEIPRVALINDFAGIAYSLPFLGEDELVTLQEGRSNAEGTRLIAGAGTGLGICALLPGGQVLSTEGGHAGFSPADAEEARLFSFVAAREGRCSREHLLSGRGLVRMLDFLVKDTDLTPSTVLAEAMTADDPAAAISELGLTGSDALATRTLSLFTSIYASQLGDLALTFLARGGVYIAGGIAPKILSVLKGREFPETFNNKPPMRHLLEAMPIRVILNPSAGLLGAIAYAASLVERDRS